jgi:hypothetical protein
MLTRHLYESDEVVGALRYSILQGRAVEMAFWIQELTDSNMSHTAFRTLVGTWLIYIGVNRPGWISRAVASWRGEDVTGQELGVNLIFCPDRDITPFALLALQSEPVDRVTVDETADGVNDIAQYFHTAIRQRRVRSAWWAAMEMGQGRAWDLLEECHDGRHRDSIKLLRGLANDELIWLAGAVTFISLLHDVRNDAEGTWYTVSDDLDRQIGRWDDLKGRRARREYAIPLSSICGCGPRWEIRKSETTLRRLYAFEASVCADRGGFWWDTMRDAGFNTETGEWVSDDAKESFYATYFPDDIPDEWSLADQKKSHGPGMLRPDEVAVTGSRWARCWLPTAILLRGAWGAEYAMHAVFGQCATYSGIERIPVWKCSDVEQHIRPVRRQFVVDG